MHFCVCFLCWRVCVGGRSAELEAEAWEPSAAQAVFLYACGFLWLCFSVFVFVSVFVFARCKTQQEYVDQRNLELQNTIRLRRAAQP